MPLGIAGQRARAHTATNPPLGRSKRGAVSGKANVAAEERGTSAYEKNFGHDTSAIERGGLGSERCSAGHAYSALDTLGTLRVKRLPVSLSLGG